MRGDGRDQQRGLSIAREDRACEDTGGDWALDGQRRLVAAELLQVRLVEPRRVAADDDRQGVVARGEALRLIERPDRLGLTRKEADCSFFWPLSNLPENGPATPRSQFT